MVDYRFSIEVIPVNFENESPLIHPDKAIWLTTLSPEITYIARKHSPATFTIAGKVGIGLIVMKTNLIEREVIALKGKISEVVERRLKKDVLKPQAVYKMIKRLELDIDALTAMMYTEFEARAPEPQVFIHIDDLAHVAGQLLNETSPGSEIPTFYEDSIWD